MDILSPPPGDVFEPQVCIFKDVLGEMCMADASYDCCGVLSGCYASCDVLDKIFHETPGAETRKGGRRKRTTSESKICLQREH